MSLKTNPFSLLKLIIIRIHEFLTFLKVQLRMINHSQSYLTVILKDHLIIIKNLNELFVA